MSSYPAVIEASALDGSNGFRIDGTVADEQTGFHASGIGDVNGDGLLDLLIPLSGYTGSGDRAAYVVFGSATGFGATFALSDLDGANGFGFTEEVGGTAAIETAAGAGDVNGDGLADFILGDPTSGTSYVVFGRSTGFDPTLALSELDGSIGFKIVDDGGNEAGSGVSGVGDINDDGFGDVIVWAPLLDDGSGEQAGGAYVVFGKASGFDASLSVTDLDGSNGFALLGKWHFDLLGGVTVGCAGDVNGDGVDDLFVGAGIAADPGVQGAVYVVYGRPADTEMPFAATIPIHQVTNGTFGFKMATVDPIGRFGWSVGAAGDVNGDGYDDVVLSANDNPNPDIVYVYFGQASPGGQVRWATDLDGTNGFQVVGLAGSTSVSGAGDFNGDGFDDFIIGDSHASPEGGPMTGAAYMIFGAASGFAAVLDVSTLDGSNGFRIDGVAASDVFGRSVSAAGDLNQDGFDDVIVGATLADPNGDKSGSSYVICGFGPGEAVTRAGTALANTIRGGAFDDTLLGRDGDDRLFGGGGADRLNGGADDDALDGGAGNDTLIAGKGGDTLNGGAGDDVFQMANRFRHDDKLDGGDGFDVLKLDGDYGFGLRVTATMLANIEELKVRDGFSYDLRFDDANVGPGQTLIASGSLLTGTNSFSIDGSREIDGSFRLYGGEGDDRLTGGALRDVIRGGDGQDTLRGGTGDDVLTGGADGDTFAYGNASDSQATSADRITDFDAANDRIDLWFTLNGVDATQAVASLADLASVFDAAHLGGHHAALATVGGSDTYLVIDANGAAGYQASGDMLIRLTDATNLDQFGAASFV